MCEFPPVCRGDPSHRSLYIYKWNTQNLKVIGKIRFFHEKLDGFYYMASNFRTRSSTVNVLKVNLRQTFLFLKKVLFWAKYCTRTLPISKKKTVNPQISNLGEIYSLFLGLSWAILKIRFFWIYIYIIGRAWRHPIFGGAWGHPDWRYTKKWMFLDIWSYLPSSAIKLHKT